MKNIDSGNYFTHANWMVPFQVFAGIVSLAISVIVMLSWQYNFVDITRIRPEYFPMTFNAAILGLLCSTSLLLFTLNYRIFSILFSVPLLMVSIWFFIKRYFMPPLGMTSTLLKLSLLNLEPTDFIPATNTCLAFIGLAVALLIAALPRHFNFKNWIVGLLATGCLGLALLSLFGYVTKFEFLLYTFDYSRMAFLTAISIAILSLSVLFIAACDVKDEQFPLFSSLMTIAVVLTFSLAILTSLHRQVFLSLMDLLDAEAQEVSRIACLRLESEWQQNNLFTTLLEEASKNQPERIESMTETLLNDVVGLEAIELLNHKGKVIKEFYAKDISTNYKSDLREDQIREQPSELGYHVDHLTDGTAIIYYQQTYNYDGNKQFIRFYYNPQKFLEDYLSSEKKDPLRNIHLSINDASIYTKKEKPAPVVASFTKHSHFQKLDINSMLEANTLFKDKLTGHLPFIMFTSGLLLSLFAGGTVYLLQRYRKQSQDLFRSNNAKSSFLTNVSHEIRTPLHGILGTGSLLQRTDLNPKQERYVQIITSSAHHLLDLVNNLLDITKIESRSFSIVHEPTNVAELCQDQIDLLSSKAKEKMIALTFKNHLPDEPKKIMVAKRPIRQILINLISNAINYTDSGEVKLELSLESTDKKSGILHIVVSDTGAGIPKEKHDEIFKKFPQIDARISETKGGTGLGLYLTRNLIHMMGGAISFKSGEGEGTTFYVDIPVSYGEKHPT